MRGGLDRFDSDIIEFGQRWHAFGGGSPEDIYEEFGLQERDYFQRLQDLIDSPIADALDQQTRTHIKRVCTARLQGVQRTET